MKKLLFLILLSLGISENTFSMKTEVDQPKEIDFTQVLPDELSLEVLENLILRSENLEGALKEIYKTSKVSKEWRRLALDHVLIRKVIEKFALTKEGAFKENAVIPLWNFLNHIKLANLSLKKGESQKEINKKIEEVDKKLKLAGYNFLYKLIDNSALAFLRIAAIPHNGSVRSVAFSPDGRYLATGSWKIANIYDLNTKKVIDTIPHNDKVRSVAFSPDGRYLATGSYKIAKIYDLKEKKVIDTITHNGVVWSVAFSPDGRYLATGSDGKIVKIYDLNTKKVIDIITHNHMVMSVAFSPDGRYLATGSNDHTSKIYDLKEKKVIDTITYNYCVISVAFSPDGKYLATGFSDNTSKIYDLKEQKVIDTITHNGVVWSVAFSLDGRYLATGSDDNRAKIYDLKEQKVIATITYNGPVNSVAFSPDGRYFATGSDANRAKIYEIINDTNKKLFIKILNYLKSKNKPYPEKNIFFNYLYSKCSFIDNEQKALKENYGFEMKQSWKDRILAKVWFK